MSEGVWRTVKGRRVYIVDGQFYFGGPDEYNRKNFQFVKNAGGKIVKNPLTTQDESSTIGNVKAGDTDGNSTVISVEKISPEDTERELESFADQYAYADHEYAEVITKDGTKVVIEGISAAVNTELAGKDRLNGATVIHNHPIWEEYGHGDAFSKYDFKISASNKTKAEYIATGDRLYYMRITKDMSEDEAYNLYNSAQNIVQEKRFNKIIKTEFLQLETMKVLSEIDKGVEFDERERKDGKEKS